MSSVSRRQFAAQLSATVTGVLVAGAGDPAVASTAMPQPPEKPAPPAEPAAVSPPTYEDHQLALLDELHRAPHLTEEMRDGIRGGLRHNRGLAERIRRVPLTHDVPPAFQFTVPSPEVRPQ